MTRLRPYLELTRLSNLPTVWTNVLVGLYAGTQALLGGPVPPLSPRHDATALRHFLSPNRGLPLLAGVSCLYVGGMALNDLLDRDIDSIERPNRPLPSGRISPPAAGAFAAVLFALGCLALALYPSPMVWGFGGGLVVTIIAYDVLHKRVKWAAGLMGLARALVVFTAASALPLGTVTWGEWWRDVGPFAVILGVYVVLVTVVAGGEAADEHAPGHDEPRPSGSNSAPAHDPDPSLPRDRGSLNRSGHSRPLLNFRATLAPAMIVLVLAAGLFVRSGYAAIWVFLAAGAVIVWLTLATRHALADPPRTQKAVATWLSGICLIDAWFLTLLGHPTAAGLAGACWVLTVLAHRRVAGT